MIKVLDIRPIIMLIINIFMIFILYSINNLISVYGIYLVVPVLLIVVPSVYLSAGKALFVICATGLVVESLLPIRGFSIVIIWLIAGALLRTQRFRFRRISFLESFILLSISNTIIIFM